jgi:hypothetical protein
VAGLIPRVFRREPPQAPKPAIPPSAAPWDGMLPRPRAERTQLRPLDTIPWSAAMSGPVNWRHDPCGRGPIEAHATGKSGETP